MRCIVVFLLLSMVGSVLTAQSATLEERVYAIAGNTGAIYRGENPSAERLLEELVALRDLNESIPALPTEYMKQNALRYRALAWLHGWAAFSRIVVESPDRRRKLLDMAPDALLPVLLQIYAQIDADKALLGEWSDPLQNAFYANSSVLLRMHYKESWPGERAIPFPYFVPGKADLAGTPQQEAQLYRNILSLWSIVYLRLDTCPRESRETLELSPHRDWLTRLGGHPTMEILDSEKKLRSRLDAFIAYLEFRERIQDQGTMEKVVSALQAMRIQDGDLADIADPGARNVLESLSRASAALDGEILHPAGIWSRYLVFLSYRDEGTLNILDASSPRCLMSFWKKRHTGDFFLQPTAQAEPAGAFLRWNRFPHERQHGAWLAHSMQAAWMYLKLREKRREEDVLRFELQHIKELRPRLAETLLAQQRSAAEIASRLSSYVEISEETPVVIASPIFCTDAESRSAAEDALRIATLAEQIRQMLEMACAKCSQEDAEIAGLLQALAGSISYADWDIYCLLAGAKPPTLVGWLQPDGL